MAKERFDFTNGKPETLRLVAQANEFIAEYRAKGLSLTVRQLYYRFVARDIIPNTFRSYKNFASMLDMGRKRGQIDWNAIEDRTRNLATYSHYEDAREFVRYTPYWYAENHWLNQDYMPEVWVEKEAQIGVIEQACNEDHVPYLACRGYLSQSEAYAAGKRFQKYISQGRKPVVFYMGDHDASGVDMSRDNFERVSLYAGADIEFVRLALNMDQIEEYNPPPQPVKEGDSRKDKYREEHGDEVWEMDALEPQVIIDLISGAIAERKDEERWRESDEREELEKQKIRDIADNWNAALAAARGEDPDETEY